MAKKRRRISQPKRSPTQSRISIAKRKNYQIQQTLKFASSAISAINKDQSLKDLINSTVEALGADPFFKTVKVETGKGIRRKHIGHASWRLIFCVRDECEAGNATKLNGCLKNERNTILLHLIFEKKKDYDNIRVRAGLKR